MMEAHFNALRPQHPRAPLASGHDPLVGSHYGSLTR